MSDESIKYMMGMKDFNNLSNRHNYSLCTISELESLAATVSNPVTKACFNLLIYGRKNFELKTLAKAIEFEQYIFKHLPFYRKAKLD
jgi:hypothetical protein